MKRCTIHIVGQSHIDLAWLWPYYPETIYDCCKLTFIRAVDNLRMHKEYVFAQSQVPIYQSLEGHFPELFAEVMKYIREGRWDVVGGMYVEAEGGEPCGESLVRQCVFGQRYFSRKVGVKVRVGWLPDSWTHPWQLPQILKKSGFDYFVFQRGAKGEQIFWWEAPDGSQVLACKPTWGHFWARPFTDLEDLALSVGLKCGVKDVLMIIGGGDHGGGPSYHEIQHIKDLAASLKPRIEVRFSTPHQFFEKLNEAADRLPVLRGELDFELVGDLTNCAEIKKKNRLNENLLLTAEIFSSIASILTNLAYPQKDLNDAWEKVLFNQFHDIIGGSVIPSAQKDAHSSYEKVFQMAEKVLKESLRAISSIVDTRGEGISVIVFNNLSWSRTDLVDVELEAPEEWKAIKLLDPEGKVTPIQTVKWKKGEGRAFVRFIFEAENVPPIGYETYKVVPSDEESYPNPIKATKEGIENAFYRIQISPTTGCIESIFDKENNHEAIDEPGKGNLLQLIEDTGDSEGRLIPGIDRSNKFTGAMWDIDSKPSIEILEEGPVRAKVRVSRAFQNSTYIQEITIYSRIRRVDFGLVVDWHEIHRALKVAFPVNIADPRLTFETQYGSIVRPANGEEQPMQQWVDMSELDGSYGLGLMNDSRYACDVRHNIIRMTILRSPTEPSYNTDEGVHEVRYSLYPHSKSWEMSGVIQRGYEFNNALILIAERLHVGTLPKTKSFLCVKPENIVVTVMKKAEDSDELTLRLYETVGIEVSAEISLDLDRPIKSARKTDLLEEETLEELKVEENKLKLTVRPYEITTIKIGIYQ